MWGVLPEKVSGKKDSFVLVIMRVRRLSQKIGPLNLTNHRDDSIQKRKQVLEKYIVQTVCASIYLRNLINVTYAIL